jgi:16S rRNA processing protein RimM
VSGLFGVRGWVKVFSDTRPRENILNYNPWLVKTREGWREMALAEGRVHGPGVIARLEGYTDRDQAQALVGAEIAVYRQQLPPAKKGEHYWVDLEGLRVVNLEGVELGTVSHLFETGANDVLVVVGDRERLLPYTRQVIRDVDLEARVLRVDWDPED